MSIFHNQELVVGLSTVLFLGLLFYLGVHKMVFRALDSRAERIRDELAEARRLREEAQATFAEFERRQREVNDLADDIVNRAKEDAEAAATQAKADLAVSIERRMRLAQEQIGQAEADAVREVRNRAITIAVAAAGEILSDKVGDSKLKTLIDDSIRSVGEKLH